MANSSGRRFETPEQVARQREVIDDTYAGRLCDIQQTADLDCTDFLVTGPTFLHRVEVKTRGETSAKYTLAFMEKEGYLISKSKITALIDRARAERSVPILLVQTHDRYLMAIVATRIAAIAETDSVMRQGREGEHREEAWKIWPGDMSVWPQDIIREYPPGAWNVWTDYAPR